MTPKALLFLATLAAAGVVPRSPGVCVADQCLRAVMARGPGYCESLLRRTVVPEAVTSTVYVTTTQTFTSTEDATSFLTSTVTPTTTEIDTVITTSSVTSTDSVTLATVTVTRPVTGAVGPNQKRKVDFTVNVAVGPAATFNPSQISSACSCISVTGTVTTVTATTPTSTVTVVTTSSTVTSSATTDITSTTTTTTTTDTTSTTTTPSTSLTTSGPTSSDITTTSTSIEITTGTSTVSTTAETTLVTTIATTATDPDLTSTSSVTSTTVTIQVAAPTVTAYGPFTIGSVNGQYSTGQDVINGAANADGTNLLAFGATGQNFYIVRGNIYEDTTQAFWGSDPDAASNVVVGTEAVLTASGRTPVDCTIDAQFNLACQASGDPTVNKLHDCSATETGNLFISTVDNISAQCAASVQLVVTPV